MELKVGLEDEEGRGLQFDETRNKSFHTIPKHCWVVKVKTIAENAEEEARWLIDIAISYLRLRHRQWTWLTPRLGDYEPDPIRVTHSSSDTHRFNEFFMAWPTIINPPWYEIDLAVSHTTTDPTFISKANLIFSQRKKNLATRVGQGLGWLTRGRRAKDRSERLLYFFTAIEALLSSDDKSAPIVQTIARHAAVLLSKNNSERARIAKLIRDLYAYRSSVVHAGTRSVLWQQANNAQKIAELIFDSVLELSDLSVSHQDFCNELAECSYGLLWPKVAEEVEK